MRYALTPFLVGTALTVARWESFHSHSRPALSLASIGALVYCFAFATPPTMVIEINAPQLRYLTGGLSREGFLLEAVPGYRAMSRLAEEWREGDLALTLYNTAICYSPDPSRVHYSGLGGWTYRSVEERLQQSGPRYDWVIFRTLQQKDFEEAHVLDDTEIIYSDPGFSLARRRDAR